MTTTRSPASESRSIYREWKTQHIDEQLDDVFRAAYGRGRVGRARTRQGTQVRLDRRPVGARRVRRLRRQRPRRGGDRSRLRAFPTGAHRSHPAHLGVPMPLDRPSSLGNLGAVAALRRTSRWTRPRRRISGRRRLLIVLGATVPLRFDLRPGDRPVLRRLPVATRRSGATTCSGACIGGQDRACSWLFFADLRGDCGDQPVGGGPVRPGVVPGQRPPVRGTFPRDLREASAPRCATASQRPAGA